MTLADEQALFDTVNLANHEPTQPLEKDDEAPYGRKSDGTPRRKPGPPPGTRTGNAIPKSPRNPGASRKPAASRRSTGTDYRPGILGILQLPAFALGAAGQLNPALALDGAAISMHAPNIAEALNDLAADNPTVAAALDRILSAGPYGAIIGACLPLAFQIAANHKAIPDGMVRSVGALPAEDFAALLMAQRQGG